MCYLVEVYDNKMSLLRRFTKTANDTNEVRQAITIHPVEIDSFIVRSWGFAYNVMPDKETPFDSKKIGFATTKLFHQRYPKNKVDSTKSQQ